MRAATLVRDGGRGTVVGDRSGLTNPNAAREREEMHSASVFTPQGSDSIARGEEREEMHSASVFTPQGSDSIARGEEREEMHSASVFTPQGWDSIARGERAPRATPRVARSKDFHPERVRHAPPLGLRLTA
jgi:hypothetical protein